MVAPFPTVTDGVTLDELRTIWSGSSPGGPFATTLLMEQSTLAALSAMWGNPARTATNTLPAERLLDSAWGSSGAWAIIPFEELEPRWKVLAVDGQSPVRKDFERDRYPLALRFSLVSTRPADDLIAVAAWPSSNRDPSKLTTVVLTGVTALVRATAYTMERKGVLYPGRDIRDVMRQADIAHISNEVPFFSDCGYPPNPGQKKLVFCSYPRYMDLLIDIGADVIELTGNHFGDYGPGAMLETLELYRSAGMQYYGGGADRAEAIQPILLEHNGNKIAFIGCNRPDFGKFPTATDRRPGAAPCDFKYMTTEIATLAARGYLVITTFQWNERDEFDPIPMFSQTDDFRRMADSGAQIVSGSQAHFPMAMEFYRDAFIHYGLGNLFFDQDRECCMIQNEFEFMDRYAVYDGRLVSVELLTMMLEDYARPRPMTAEERAAFLQDYFHLSGWLPVAPIAAVEPTQTLTPIALPAPTATPAR